VIISKPAQAGHREEGGVGLAFLQLAHPGLHIAAEGDDLKVRPQGEGLRFAPQGGRAQTGALRQLAQGFGAVRDEAVARMCTAMSMSPALSDSSSSRVNRPLPPELIRRSEVSLSPVVVKVTTSASMAPPEAALRLAAIWWACASASGEPRVPRRMERGVEADFFSVMVCA
jgi:hypothetical protein